jgi:predicted secreted protein
VSTHTVTATGSRLAVRPGDVVEVRLPENGTTGYVWEVARLPPGVREEASSLAGAGTAPGSGGTRVLRFVVDDGRGLPGALRLVLRRPWEEAGAEEACEVLLDPA